MPIVGFRLKKAIKAVESLPQRPPAIGAAAGKFAHGIMVPLAKGEGLIAALAQIFGYRPRRGWKLCVVAGKGRCVGDMPADMDAVRVTAGEERRAAGRANG